MKQDDDLLHNYTVAKITEDMDFSVNSRAYNLVLTVHNSVFFQLVYSRKGYLLNEKSEFSKYASSKLYKMLEFCAHCRVCVWQ